MRHAIVRLTLLFISILFSASACSWALQAEAPTYQGRTIPSRVGVELVDNVGNKYGQKVVESLKAWGVFESIVFPYRGQDVDAILTLTLETLDGSGAVVASNILLGIGTLGLAGQGTDSKHRVSAQVDNTDGRRKQRYHAIVDSYFHRVTGMRDEQIEQRTRYLQTSKLAHALALQFEKNPQPFLPRR